MTAQMPDGVGVYQHPKRLTKKAVALAEAHARRLGEEAQRVGGFPADAIGVSVQKTGAWVTFTNALGTIAQHKVAYTFLREHRVYAGFSYQLPGDPFTCTVLMYPATTPDAEANKESYHVVKLLAARAAHRVGTAVAG